MTACVKVRKAQQTDATHQTKEQTSADAYPTQDGVGQQFTISGPQHTTKESFIGNTSSIVLDGYDDYMSVNNSPDFELDSAGAFSADWWFKTSDWQPVNTPTNATLGDWMMLKDVLTGKIKL